MSAGERLLVDRFGRPVPAEPVVRLRVDRPAGRVPLRVDGVAVPLARGADPHRAGLAAAARRARELGRPVRVEMAGPWSCWPLVVHPDGAVDDGRGGRPRPASGRAWSGRRRTAPVLGGLTARPRRHPVGVLAAAAALVSVVLVGTVVGTAGTGVATVAAAAPAACRDVTLFAVNGAGASGGETLAAVTDPLVQEVGDRLAVVSLAGPEVGASYEVDQQQAVTALADQVVAQLEACPASRTMLFGYSQGAHVAGDLAARVGAGQEPRVPAEKVLAIGLFGDPARDPEARTVPDGATGHGVLPAREGGFGALAGRTIQVCAPEDPVCATPAGSPAPPLEQAVAAGAHTGYADLAVAPDTPAPRWASDSLSRLITSLPAGEAAEGAPTSAAPGTTAPGTTAPGSTGESGPGDAASPEESEAYPDSRAGAPAYPDDSDASGGTGEPGATTASGTTATGTRATGTRATGTSAPTTTPSAPETPAPETSAPETSTAETSAPVTTREPAPDGEAYPQDTEVYPDGSGPQAYPEGGDGSSAHPDGGDASGTAAPTTPTPPGTGSDTAAPTTTARPDTETGGAGAGTGAGTEDDTGATGRDGAGADTGALWALTSGLAGFQDSNGGNVEGGGLVPEEVESPNVPGRRVVKLEVPEGAKRSEVRPEEAQDIREGEHLFFGYSAFLPADFPTDTRSWQVIWQLHDGGTNTSPPVALEIQENRLWLSNVGERVRDLGPVRPGENLDVQLDVRFAIGGGEVSVYRGGQPVLQGFRPPRGTMIDELDFLKTGIYRDASAEAEPATIFLNDLKIGETLESVSGLAGVEGTPVAPLVQGAR
ncbi:heparin lyase I family protein [Actinomycetospora cinnamomea]|uniref:Polysaccharide lyase-like protein n=1 Tax=Actinomycetospora cinnamomea TaxID=663609 RepID=A0A2U1F8A0_9PSEU|nr:heparin lyase I family protein [Actinomycetospora cinnamomea]PVZ08423.1 polysaccharide lyase-like protein [Actinomycetospora cinnamomea]